MQCASFKTESCSTYSCTVGGDILKFVLQRPQKAKTKKRKKPANGTVPIVKKREYVGRNKINMASGQQWVLVEMVQAFYEVRLALTAVEWNNFLPVLGSSLPELLIVNFEVRKYLWPD